MLLVAVRRNELSVRFESKDCGFKTQNISYKIHTCKFNTKNDAKKRRQSLLYLNVCNRLASNNFKVCNQLGRQSKKQAAKVVTKIHKTDGRKLVRNPAVSKIKNTINSFPKFKKLLSYCALKFLHKALEILPPKLLSLWAYCSST